MEHSKYYELNVKHAFDIISELVYSLRLEGASDKEIKDAINMVTSKALKNEVV